MRAEELPESFRERAWRQALTEPWPFDRAQLLVEHLVALQAQMPKMPLLSLSARLNGGTQKDLVGLLAPQTRKIWGFRGTMHLVLTRDLPLFSAVGQAFWSVRTRSYLATEAGVGEDDVQALALQVHDSMEDDSDLDRKEIVQRLGDLSDWEKKLVMDPWGGIFRLLVMQGQASMNPLATPTRFRREGQGEKFGPEAAMTLAKRIENAFGPLGKSRVARYMGVRRSALSGDLPEAETSSAPPSPVRLLPRFDPYLLAYPEWKGLLKPTERRLVFQTAGHIAPTVIVDGLIVGVWDLGSGPSADLTVRPFRSLGPEERRQLKAEVERIRRFLGRKKVKLHMARRVARG